MNKVIDAVEARTQLGSVIKKAERDNTRFIVHKRGKPSVVILSVEDFMKNVLRKSTLLVEIQCDAAGAGLDMLTDKQIDKEIRSARKAKKRT